MSEIHRSNMLVQVLGGEEPPKGFRFQSSL